jgi:acyl CoA:acetate/3-ketoacid CoA transferase alpha subunit
MKLEEAIRAFVRPGDHLHFSSTPSRANAAIREVVRAFTGKRPEFVLSTSGFHSLAHLLAKERLGRRYIACFFGDNYPAPRPNPLYQELLREGASLECWSLLAYVTALRAGALGQPWAHISSLAGTTLGDELAEHGRYDRDRCAVAALRPDITFIHAPMGDEEGNLAFSAPYGESFWAALGAKRGVIATVERMVPASVLRQMPEAIRIAPSRVLSVSAEPFGAHPQPLYTTPAFFSTFSFDDSGYVDDFEHYGVWRKMARAIGTDEARYREFYEKVLSPEVKDGHQAYVNFVGERRLAGLADAARFRTSCAERDVSAMLGARRRPQRGEAALIDIAADVITERVRLRGHRSLLAGIGHAFFAAHAARQKLAGEGLEVAVTVETGLYDVACGNGCHGFLLSHDHIASSRALSSIEDVLGVLTTGADNRCIGVLGAAEVDAMGNVNSTRLGDGTFLVGSGGANDIASSADEVIVLTTCDPRRLVRQVAHITSPGHRVCAVVTDRAAFARGGGAEGVLRSAQDDRWRMTHLVLTEGETKEQALSFVREACPWEFTEAPDLRIARESKET